ncbi:MAG TPA: M1 family metallopeptidase [Gemmatimonadaceae bacterium]|nr:M1 family metallopeptidase [Gemmatimonadaceae bacterium]
MRTLHYAAVAIICCSGGASAQSLRPYQPAIDVLDYAFVLSLPDTGSHIRGDAMITFRRTGRTDTLVLDLRQLRVTRVLFERRVRRYRRTDSTIHIPLPRGDTGTYVVNVVYDGPVTDGLIVRRDSARRWTYFGDNWPNRARYWLPTVDHPSDKATVTWSVSAPAGRTIVANGAQFERRVTGTGARARAITRWRESKPIPTYLMVIAAAPLVRHNLGQTACGFAEIARCVPQQVYTAPEQRRAAPGNFARAGEMVRHFAQRVGPYPYEKLAHLQSATRFGGMENASAIFYNDRDFRRDGVGERLIAHETAHQWFGNSVTPREWPHLWLSEGFATYWAALWAQHAHGDSAFRASLTSVRNTILANTNAVAKRPVIDTVETELLRLLNANSYQKGGFVLHMLRNELGDSTFFTAVRDYYTRYKHGTAVTFDLQTAFEKASGRELTWFFDQWLRRPGYPELDVAWAVDSASNTIEIAVNQAPRFGTFQFELRLGLRDSAGTVRRIEVGIPAQDSTRLALPISGPVTSVEVDPDIQLLARTSVRRIGDPEPSRNPE